VSSRGSTVSLAVEEDELIVHRTCIFEEQIEKELRDTRRSKYPNETGNRFKRLMSVDRQTRFAIARPARYQRT